MRHRSAIALLSLAIGALTPGIAQAAPGYATANVNMRAGPSTANPVVATVPAGAPVAILNCLGGWSWCDTLWAGNRGWVSGSYLNAAWRGRAVPVVASAPRLGVPIVAYNANTYWRRHYVGRSWYPHRVRRGVHGCVRGPYGGVACR